MSQRFDNSGLFENPSGRPMSQTIRFFGRVNSQGGGVFFKSFVESAARIWQAGSPDRRIVVVDPSDHELMKVAVAESRADDLNVWFWPHPSAHLVIGRRVVWSVFESDRLPAGYVESLRTFDVVWTPSHWGKAVLSACGLSPEVVDVVPEGVDPSAFPLTAENGFPVDRPFRFLAIGKYEERKGYRFLLDSFAQCFGGRSDVELLVKCDYFLDHANRRTQFEGEVRRRGLDNVLAAWGDWDEPAFRSLYTGADAFVLPTRAEGWGLPIIEALACGLPVITTNYSGQTEYLSSIVGGYFPISHTVVPICDPDFLRYWDGVDACGAKWAEPDRQSLSDGLTAVVNAFENWVGRSRRASQVIRQRFGWEQAAQAGLAALATRGAL